MRGATNRLVYEGGWTIVSIHAPHAGRDRGRSPCPQRPAVSIHAPHAGRDLLDTFALVGVRSFNPRAPCGARRRRTATASSKPSFNPRAPCGARRHSGRGAGARDVSIHAPHAGRDDKHAVGHAVKHGFNPRAPCGARRLFERLVFDKLVFQSTRPMRGATSVITCTSPRSHVSIHAPHAGRDYITHP